MELQDELLEDILINIREFSKVHFFRDQHFPSIDPQSKEDKDTVHPWPNYWAINRFHRKNSERFKDLLRRRNIKIFESKFLFVYLFKADDKLKNQADETLDYQRFEYLNNYFAIKRLQLWFNHGKRINITLNHSDAFNYEFETKMSTSNLDLLNKLLRHEKRDNINWTISREDDRSKYLKLDFAMSKLVFDDLQLYQEVEININLDEDIPTERIGYILEEDRELYKNIVEKSYSNFSQLAEDRMILDNVKAHHQKYSK